MQLLMDRSTSPLWLSYRAIGSGGGQGQFLSGAIDYGVGDIPLDSSQYDEARNTGEMLHFPFVLVPMAFNYNLLGVSRLRLSPCTLAGIFMVSSRVLQAV
jgi:phosphate transport system substrate-binding protein